MNNADSENIQLSAKIDLSTNAEPEYIFLDALDVLNDADSENIQLAAKIDLSTNAERGR